MQKRKKTSQSGRLLLKTGISQNSLGTDFPPAHRCHLGLGHLSWGLLCCKRTPCHSHDFHPIDTSGNVKVSVTPWIPSGPPGSSVHGISQPRTQELPFPSAGDLSNPGIKPVSPEAAGRFFTREV